MKKCFSYDARTTLVRCSYDAHTIQYNSIQYKTIQFNTIPYNAIAIQNNSNNHSIQSHSNRILIYQKWFITNQFLFLEEKKDTCSIRKEYKKRKSRKADYIFNFIFVLKYIQSPITARNRKLKASDQGYNLGATTFSTSTGKGSLM